MATPQKQPRELAWDEDELTDPEDEPVPAPQRYQQQQPSTPATSSWIDDAPITPRSTRLSYAPRSSGGGPRWRQQLRQSTDLRLDRRLAPAPARAPATEPIVISDSEEDEALEQKQPQSQPDHVVRDSPIYQAGEDEADRCADWELYLRSNELELPGLILEEGKSVRYVAFHAKVRDYLAGLLPSLVGAGDTASASKWFFTLIDAVAERVATELQRANPKGFHGNEGYLRSIQWAQGQMHKVESFRSRQEEPQDHVLNAMNRVYAEGPSVMNSITLQTLLMAGAARGIHAYGVIREDQILMAYEANLRKMVKRFLVASLVHREWTRQRQWNEAPTDYSAVLHVGANVPRDNQVNSTDHVSLALRGQTPDRVFRWFAALFLGDQFHRP